MTDPAASPETDSAGDPDSSGTARSSASVALWTVLSRAIGLGRVLVIGALLGPTYVANIFQAGYLLPGNVFTLLAGPVLCSVIVPAVAHALRTRDMVAARVLFARISGRILVVAGFGTMVLALVSPLFAWTLVAGVPAPQRTHALLLGITLVVTAAPQVLLFTIAEIGLAAQQARGRFALATAAPAIESLFTIVVVSIGAWLFGRGLDVAHTPVAMMLFLGVGTTISVAVHAGVQLYGMAISGLWMMPRWDWRSDDEAIAAVRRMARSIPVAACPAATNYGLAAVAATVPGGVVVVQLSYQVFYALEFLGSRAVSMVALPHLSATASGRDTRAFAAAWRECLFYAVLAATPPMVLLAVFAAPTADLLANGELRRSGFIGALAGCLLIVAFAQLIGGLRDLGQQTLFARFDDRGPRIASVLALAVVMACAAASLLLPAGALRLQGLIAAILIGEIAAAALIVARVSRSLAPERFTAPIHVQAWVAGTVAMAPGVFAGRWVLHHFTLDRLATLPVLIGAALIAGIALIVVLRTFYFARINADAAPA
jgi:peptidoglycan biosynthesis protein MviN/MurJ (putative lipid II flippase)